MSKQTNKHYVLGKKIKEQSLTIVFFLVVLVVIINSILIYTRFDLTENKVYSISSVSQDIIRDLDNPVYIDYYLSPSLTTTNQEPQQIVDLLQEYAARSRGKVIFSLKDASKEENKQDLERYKIEQKQIQVVEKEQASIGIVYTGIVISYLERNKVIPFIIDPSSLEYQVTSKLLEVYTDKDREIGILSLDASLSDERELGPMNQVLAADYKVSKIVVGEAIGENIDALVVIGANPESLNLPDEVFHKTLYYLDQFIMSGKGVYFATDRVHIILSQGVDGNVQSNLLFDMLAHYGVEVKDQIIADELNNFIPLNQGQGFQTLQPYSLWIAINGQNTNKEHPITSAFGGLDFYWTSPLVASEGASDKFVSLVESSENSWVLNPGPRTTPISDEGILPNEQPSDYINAYPAPDNFSSQKNSDNEHKYTVVAVINGSLESAVTAEIIPPIADDKNELQSNVDNGRFLVSGSYFYLTDMYRASNATFNFSFLSNATEWLSNNENLLSIKSRRVRDIQLNKITDEDKRLRAIFFVKILNLVIIPLLIVIIAIIILLYRRNVSRKKI